MTDREKVALLRASGRFASWPDSRLGGLLRFFDEVGVLALDSVAVEGAACHQFVVVADGRLESFRGDRAEMLCAGDSFGWSAMERRGANEETVIAATDATLLVLSHAQFRAAIASPAPTKPVKARPAPAEPRGARLGDSIESAV
jgi:CRP-like cAMP-binding protein